ncbi:CDGSH iron-sulfur domain-containing protein 3, mitochondrial [Procambarus clarkii]|uniref:CDGSH iron-sulfur domain-containing protein 3, mitochondrial n=1 Tax=Procambarus clarkii TaxID=6728 RepID=UPI001E671D6B|nr:CDGSH iron-sulfur domain-containing protein 3, mitochondrial-like [Procambarus clarkii]
MYSIRSYLRSPVQVSLRSLYTSVATYTSAPPQDPPGQKDQQQEEPVEEWKQKGRINDKKPIKVNLVGGKRYLWCACGYSKNQPFCDGTHLWSRFRLKIKQSPKLFKAPKDGPASLCLCKQTNNPPYCDGIHRRKEIQDAVITEP